MNEPPLLSRLTRTPVFAVQLYSLLAVSQFSWILKSLSKKECNKAQFVVEAEKESY